MLLAYGLSVRTAGMSAVTDLAINITCKNVGARYKVRELVNNGLDINSFNEDGETALHEAVERGNVKMIKLLS